MKEFIEKLIGRLEELADEHREVGFKNEMMGFSNIADKQYAKQTAYLNTIEIVNELAEEYKNDCCEWKQDGVYLICQNHENNLACVEDEGYRYNYCPICGKKIKVVDNIPAWKTAVMNTFLARK